MRLDWMILILLIILFGVFSGSIVYWMQSQDYLPNSTQIEKIPIFHVQDYPILQNILNLETMKESKMLLTNEMDALTSDINTIRFIVEQYMTLFTLLVVQSNSPSPFILVTNEPVLFYDQGGILKYANAILSTEDISDKVDLVVIPPHRTLRETSFTHHKSKSDISLNRNCKLRAFSTINSPTPQFMTFMIRTSSILKKLFRCFPIVKPIHITLYMHFNAYYLDETKQIAFEQYTRSKSHKIRPSSPEVGYYLISPDVNTEKRAYLHKFFRLPKTIPYFALDPKNVQLINFQYFLEVYTLPKQYILDYMSWVFTVLRYSSYSKYMSIFLDSALVSQIKNPAFRAGGFPAFQETSQSILNMIPPEVDAIFWIPRSALNLTFIESEIKLSNQMSLFKMHEVPLNVGMITIRSRSLFENIFKLFPITMDLYSALNTKFNCFCSFI